MPAKHAPWLWQPAAFFFARVRGFAPTQSFFFCKAKKNPVQKKKDKVLTGWQATKKSADGKKKKALF
jgi:hypothetical protein